jgi:hypothetical protein
VICPRQDAKVGNEEKGKGLAFAGKEQSAGRRNVVKRQRRGGGGGRDIHSKPHAVRDVLRASIVTASQSLPPAGKCHPAGRRTTSKAAVLRQRACFKPGSPGLVGLATGARHIPIGGDGWPGARLGIRLAASSEWSQPPTSETAAGWGSGAWSAAVVRWKPSPGPF